MKLSAWLRFQYNLTVVECQINFLNLWKYSIILSLYWANSILVNKKGTANTVPRPHGQKGEYGGGGFSFTHRWYRKSCRAGRIVKRGERWSFFPVTTIVQEEDEPGSGGPWFRMSCTIPVSTDHPILQSVQMDRLYKQLLKSEKQKSHSFWMVKEWTRSLWQSYHLPIARRSNGDSKQAVLLTWLPSSSCLPSFPVTSSNSLSLTVAGPCRSFTGLPY